MITEHIRVFLIDMPGSVRGLTTYVEEDGTYYYTMLINARLGSRGQIEAYEHELAHINNGDFHKMVTADQVEAVTHNL